VGAGHRAPIRDTLQARRSTWQVWHVRAEAQRRVRAANLPADQVERSWTCSSTRSWHHRVGADHPPQDDVAEPAELRRRDGSSVYEVAGSALFTSAAILAAEQHLVTPPAAATGAAPAEDAVAIALLEQAANGVTLNAGQAALVTGMATSGARLQLAIAPAGTGKTTAMRALAAAWDETAAPSSGSPRPPPAAAVLREQLGAGTDTLAKLTWSIAHDDLPDWAQRHRPRTLVVIDEAGMADTLSLAAVVDFVIARGGSVRLIGDDQQLAAIGAGGVLRDIAATHGALHLDELMRFVDPAEGAASLALRDGNPRRWGSTSTVAGSTSATSAPSPTTCSPPGPDRPTGWTRSCSPPPATSSSQLNQRAQPTAWPGPTPGAGVPLADGNTAYVGEQVITRSQRPPATPGSAPPTG
jgi:hypothetical protein